MYKSKNRSTVKKGMKRLARERDIKIKLLGI